MKRLFSAFLAAALSLSLAACGAPAPASASQPASAPASSAPAAPVSGAQSEAAAFPVTVTDAAGRRVTIEAEPKTLVSGYYITTSMLIALGQQQKLVGVEAKAAARPIYSLAAPGLLELPSVGTAKEFDLEGCAALQPDLVILPLKLKDVLPALEQLGVSALAVDPENMEKLNDTIALLGAATGASARAQELLAYNADTKAFLEELLAGAERPRVYLAGNSSYLQTAGGAMYQNALLDLAGGENVAARLTDAYWAEVSYEQLLAWDPQVIVMAAGADYTQEDILNDAQLAGLDAVKNGRVYAMPGGVEAWDSPVPGALVGSRWVASVLHGQLYPASQFAADAQAFYKTFYGVDIDPALLGV